MTDTDKLDELSEATPKCLHMTREMWMNCPQCNPLLYDPTPRKDLTLPPPVGYVSRATAEAEKRAAVEACAEAAFNRACDFVPTEKWGELALAIRTACANTIRARGDQT